MTKPGPRPMPTRFKEIFGNPGKRPLNENEPQPDTLDDFSPPEHIANDELAVRKWGEAVRVLYDMQVMTVADRETLARYCLVWSHWMQMREKCRQLGREIMHYEADPNRTDGRLRIKWAQPAPWAVDEKAARKDLLQLEREFGLTPSSRSQVTIHSNKADDPFEAFLAERGDRAGA
jgi:P27 family predicted phage terminase small subunit